MTDRLDLPQRYRRILEGLLRAHVPDAEVWAYGSRITGESHEGSDLDLVVRGPGLEPLGDGFFRLLEAIEESNIPILVQAHDWARLPEGFHGEIERDYVVLLGPEKANSKGEWREVVLGNVIELKRGYDLPQRNRLPGSIPLVSSSGITDYHTEAKVKGPGIVTGRYGTLGQVFYLRDDFWPLNTTLYVRDFKGNYPRFIAYLLREIDFSAYSDKAAVPGINRNHLHQATVRIPAVAEQREIAHILGTLDDKIELNRRMNETLEEMARAIFKSWFVDFDPVHAKAALNQHAASESIAQPATIAAQGGTDYEVSSGWTMERARAYLDKMDPSIAALFPDRFVDSELGEIPEGWEVGKFGDVVTRLRDNENPANSPSTAFSHFSIPAYDEGQTPKRESGENIKSTKSSVPMDVVLLSKLNPEIKRVWIPDVVPGERAICSTEFLVLRARPPFTRSYVYCLTSSALFREQIKSLVTGTSKSHQRAPADAVLSLDQLVPSPKIIDTFELSASKLLSLALSNRRQSQGLAVQRDVLLPTLLAGQVSVR